MVTLHFSNETDSPLDLMVEPWGNIIVVQPGSRFAIHYPPPPNREDTSRAEYHVGMLRFWCEGDTFEVDVDGERIFT